MCVGQTHRLQRHSLHGMCRCQRKPPAALCKSPRPLSARFLPAQVVKICNDADCFSLSRSRQNLACYCCFCDDAWIELNKSFQCHHVNAGSLFFKIKGVSNQPQQQQLIWSVAVQAVCLLSRTRSSSERSSHARKGEGSASSAAAAARGDVGGGTWTTAAVQCSTQRGTPQSSVKWAVQPMCHTQFMEGSVCPRKRARVQCLVAWCLRCMPMGHWIAATHKWERSCIEGVPPPREQRGLLVSAAVVAARIQVEVGELSGWLTHTHACL